MVNQPSTAGTAVLGHRASPDASSDRPGSVTDLARRPQTAAASAREAAPADLRSFHDGETTVKRCRPYVPAMDVELVRWPGDEVRLDDARRAGAARLVLVPEGVVPPMPDDVLEDWVRLPASDDDIRLRVKVLSERARSTLSRRAAASTSRACCGSAAAGSRSAGRVRASPPPCSTATTRSSAGTRCRGSDGPSGFPGRNVLDVHIVRLRRRLTPLELAIRTVRSRGLPARTRRDDLSGLAAFAWSCAGSADGGAARVSAVSDYCQGVDRKLLPRAHKRETEHPYLPRL